LASSRQYGNALLGVRHQEVAPREVLLEIEQEPHGIGVRYGGQGAHALPPQKKKNRKKNFSSNYYVKLEHFRAKIM